MKTALETREAISRAIQDWEHATLLFCAGVLAVEVRGKGD